MKIEITSEFQEVFDAIKDKELFTFVTGVAGTGKSTNIHLVKERFGKVGVCAPTGIAGLNVGGSTIHSMFNIPPLDNLTKDIVNRINIGKLQDYIKSLDLIIIDEISMCSANMLDAVFFILNRCLHGKPIPILAYGDAYQLSPVKGDFFFNCNSLKDQDFPIIEFTKVFRQDDQHFVDILNSIRIGETKYLNELNSICYKKPKHFVPIITTTNKSVDAFNSAKLRKIKSESRVYTCEIKGDVNLKAIPTNEHVELKVGARVIFVKNDQDKRWVNGTIGKVTELKEHSVMVEIDGYEYQVEYEEWVIYKKNEVVGKFIQIPLRLAWAITVHKSQGMTLKEAQIDFTGGSFADGQLYTSLSRLTSLDGLYLRFPISPLDVKCSKQVKEFFGE